MTFSVNQNNQIYVVKALGTAKLLPTDAKGTLFPVFAANEKKLYYQYINSNGRITTDFIPLDLIHYVKAASFNKQRRLLKQATVDIAEPIIAGQDYLLRFTIRQAFGMSDQDVYIKHGIYRAKTGDAKADVLNGLKTSLDLNFSREITKWFDFEVANNMLVITEHPQTDQYIRGVYQVDPVIFTVSAAPIINAGMETQWATIEYPTDANKYVINGYDIADLEYFLLGERGDRYRNVGWPYVIPTDYQVDPTKEYDVLTIHYSYVGPNESVQQSEKDITFVVDHEVLRAYGTDATSIWGATLNAAGLTTAQKDFLTSKLDLTGWKEGNENEVKRVEKGESAEAKI